MTLKELLDWYDNAGKFDDILVDEPHYCRVKEKDNQDYLVSIKLDEDDRPIISGIKL